MAVNATRRMGDRPVAPTMCLCGEYFLLKHPEASTKLRKIFISSSAESAPENFYTFGFLDVARELVFIFPRVG
jgi:hypothetical protein